MFNDTCPICAGHSYDEVLATDIDVIERCGWMVQFVSAPLPWAYTIGLTGSFAHPELTLVGLDYRSSVEVLNRFAEQVAQGVRLRPGTTQVDGRDAELVDVHPDHWSTDRFGNWWVVTEAMDVPMDSEPRALQVLWPTAVDQHRLDGPPGRARRRGRTGPRS